MLPVPTVDALVAKLSSPQSEIAAALRDLIRKADSHLEEAVKWGYPCFERGGNVCSIMPFKAHINLAFFRGAELSDPDGLLEGSGKGMRHVKFRTLQDVRRRPLTQLIKEAVALNLAT